MKITCKVGVRTVPFLVQCNKYGHVAADVSEAYAGHARQGCHGSVCNRVFRIIVHPSVHKTTSSMSDGCRKCRSSVHKTHALYDDPVSDGRQMIFRWSSDGRQMVPSTRYLYDTAHLWRMPPTRLVFDQSQRAGTVHCIVETYQGVSKIPRVKSRPWGMQVCMGTLNESNLKCL